MSTEDHGPPGGIRQGNNLGGQFFDIAEADFKFEIGVFAAPQHSCKFGARSDRRRGIHLISVVRTLRARRLAWTLVIIGSFASHGSDSPIISDWAVSGGTPHILINGE